MDQQDINTLKLLEAIEKDDTQSQRDLSRALGISLGLVNSLLKKFAQKGYFKITTLPKNRVKYILTPKGFAEKLALTYRYISHSINFYVDIRNKICTIVEAIATAGEKNVVIYGANELAEIACVVLREYNINLTAIIDDEKAGEKIFGLIINKASLLSHISFDAIIVAHHDRTPFENLIRSLDKYSSSKLYSLSIGTNYANSR